MHATDVIVQREPGVYKAVGSSFNQVRDALKSLPFRQWDGQKKAWLVNHPLEQATEMLKRCQVMLMTDEAYKSYRRERIQHAVLWCQENTEYLQSVIFELQTSINGYSHRSTSVHLAEKHDKLALIRLAMGGLQKERRSTKENDAIIAVQEMLT